MNSNPFAIVAVAGHTTMGGGKYCECGTENCICDPGEMRVTNQLTTDQRSTNGIAPSGTEGASGLDPSVGVMLFTLVLLIGLRMRF
jgi:hypothetical protein